MSSLHPIQIYREHAKLTVAQLAEKLGVSAPTISRWERGRRKIDRSLWGRISAQTGIPQAQLAGIEIEAAE